MAVTASLPVWICLAASLLRPAAPEGQETITAESGKNVTLTCRTPNNNNNIIVVEWSRADLKEEYVLLYRDGHFVPTYQQPSFRNRVELQDRWMKDGDVSLILKNVMVNDAGTYECRVFMRRTNREKRTIVGSDPISSITLRVVPPPAPGGGSAGLRVGLSVAALPLLLLVF